MSFSTLRSCSALVVVAVMSSVLVPTTAGAHSTPVVLEAAADGPAVAQTNRQLIGVGWDRARFTARRMRPLRPNLVRIDASFELLYPQAPALGQAPVLDTTAFGALADEIARAIRIGGEPVVILSYTPMWLAEDRPSSDRTKVPPRDVTVWGAIVLEVVEQLAGLGVSFFEVWNEPDLPTFFQGFLTEFLEQIYRPSAVAVLEAERRTGVDLKFGGCGCFFADPAWMLPMMSFALDNDLPLDFLSWHHYGNTPFLGPDGAEPLGPPEFRPLLAPLRQRNPVTSASVYGDQIAAVRSWRDAMYTGERKPELWIDEWNLSAGGFDHRHDTVVGAAFQAATLIEFQRAGLDRASVFRSVDPAYGPDVVPARPELYGGWGLVGRYGTVKPAWHAHRFWRELGDDVLAFTSAHDSRLGVSGVLTRRDARRFVAIVSNFQAAGEHSHPAELRFGHAGERRWTVRVSYLDGSGTTFDATPSSGKLVVPIELAPNTAALVELRARV